MAGFTGLKIDTWPRWALLALSSIALFAIGFYVNQTWATVVTVQQHIPISTLSFESVSRTTSYLINEQKEITDRQYEVLRKLVELETTVRLNQERERR